MYELGSQDDQYPDDTDVDAAALLQELKHGIPKVKPVVWALHGC